MATLADVHIEYLLHSVNRLCALTHEPLTFYLMYHPLIKLRSLIASMIYERSVSFSRCKCDLT
jgi:uncharacterized membrane protein